MLFAPVAASGRHLFLDAAAFQEILLVFFQQPPQQEICLMNQHQRNVGKRDIIAQLADADIILLLTLFTMQIYMIPLFLPNKKALQGLQNRKICKKQKIVVPLHRDCRGLSSNCARTNVLRQSLT